MSTADKLNYLLETKNEIKNAIVSKGITVKDTDTFRSYASKISNISGTVIDDDFYNMRTNNGTDGKGLFAYTSTEVCANTDFIEFVQNLDVSKIKSCEHMFYNSNFTNLNLSNWDTSNIINMIWMFSSCSNLTDLDISNFDTSNTINIKYMFAYCSKLKNINVNHFNINKITSIYGTFQNMSTLNYLNLSNWDTSNINEFTFAFSSNNNLITIEGILDLTSAIYISYMFNNCTKLENVKIKNLNYTGLDLSKSTNLSYDSIMYLINNLIETTTTKSINLGATNLAKLTDEEKAIATSKGWTLG